MAHETEGKDKEMHLGKQKNVGVNTMEIVALNKKEPVEKGLELVLWPKGSQSEDKGNSDAKQNKATGEGLELVCGTKGSQSEDQGLREEIQKKSIVCKTRFEKDWDQWFVGPNAKKRKDCYEKQAGQKTEGTALRRKRHQQINILRVREAFQEKRQSRAEAKTPSKPRSKKRPMSLHAEVKKLTYSRARQTFNRY